MKQLDNTTPHKACDYDKNVRQTIPFYELFHAETIDLVKLLKPYAETWVDTGCGTGYLVDRAFEHFPHTTFVLMDPSESMLIEARKRLQRIPSDRIKFINTVRTSDLSKNAGLKADVITAIMCHHYLTPEKRDNATRMCFDMLTDDGLYITFENIRPDSERSVALCLKRWKKFQTSQGRNTQVVEEHAKRFDKAYFPITVNEHIDLLKKCGFSIAELFWYSQMQAGFYAIKLKKVND